MSDENDTSYDTQDDWHVARDLANAMRDKGGSADDAIDSMHSSSDRQRAQELLRSDARDDFLRAVRRRS
jgi:hypothetical protein